MLPRYLTFRLCKHEWEKSFDSIRRGVYGRDDIAIQPHSINVYRIFFISYSFTYIRFFLRFPELSYCAANRSSLVGFPFTWELQED